MAFKGITAFILGNNGEGGGGGGGTSNYNELSNKPQINGHVLTGNKSSGDLGIKIGNVPIDGNLYISDLENSYNQIKPTYASQTYHGITFVVNPDKSITANGTADGDATLTVAHLTPSESGLKLSGTPEGGSSSTYYLYVVDNTTSEHTVDEYTYEPVAIPVSENDCSIKLRIKSGTVCEDVVFKPMVRYSTDPATYVPAYTSNEDILSMLDEYEATVGGLNARVGIAESRITNLQTNKQDRLEWDDAPEEESVNPVTSDGVYKGLKSQEQLLEDTVGFGAWNLANVNWTQTNPYVHRGITYDQQSDNSFILSGTCESSGNSYYKISNALPIKAGVYKLFASKTETSDVWIDFTFATKGNIRCIAGNVVEVELTNDDTVSIFINVKTSAIVTNFLVQPMIYDASLINPPYIPYHASVEELLEDVETALATKADTSSLGTAATKNSTSVVTQSTDLVESGAVYDAIVGTVGWIGGNLFDKNSLSEENGYLQNTGEVYSSNNWVISDYIPVASGMEITLSDFASGAQSPSFAFYNSSKTFVSGAAYSGRVTISIKVPIGVSFIKISVLKANLDTAKLLANTVLEQKSDNSVIGTVEDGATASQAYAVGSHFIRDGAFCTVTSAISANESLVGSSKFTSGDVATELTNALIERSVITSSNDLNDYKQIGIYVISTHPTNAPESIQNCILEVIPRTNGGVIQRITEATNSESLIYVRNYSGSPLSWKPWFKFEGTIVS